MIFISRGRALFLLVFSLCATLIPHEGLFAMTEPDAPSHEKPKESAVRDENVMHEKRNVKEDLFSTIPEEVMKTFQLIIDAKSPENIKGAISRTIALKGQKGHVAETAAFLLGDLYKRQWEQGNEKALDQALVAYGQAIRAYTNSENASKALLKKGDIYFYKKLYPEALGNYNRVLSQGPSNPYALSAHVRMARSFQKWERWHDGLQLIDKSTNLSFNPEQQDALTSVRAECLYQMGRFEEAYQAYQLLFKTDRSHTVSPGDLAAYGEVAYRTGHYRGIEGEVMAILKKSYDTDPREPSAPLALARFGFLSKLGGDTEAAETAANLVYAGMANVPNVKTGKIIVSTANLVVLKCPDPCKSGLADINLKQLEKVSKSLLLDVPFTVTAQGAILDGLTQMQRYKRYEMAEDVYTLMIAALPSSSFSPYTFYTKNKLNQLVFEHFDTLKKAKPIVALHRRFWRTFEHRMNGEAGLKIAKGYLKQGDLSTALNLLAPVAKNKLSPASEEALHELALLRARLGEYQAAEHAMIEYRIRYPENHAILLELGDIYARQELYEPAAVAYEEWLDSNPDDKKRDRIYEKLTRAYRGRQDVGNQVRIYEAWIKEDPDKPQRLYMPLADLYYQQQRHKDAIRYFELALRFEKKQKEIDWALLRLSTSYVSDKQPEKAKAILQKLTKQAKNKLIKQMAEEKNLDLVSVSAKQ